MAVGTAGLSAASYARVAGANNRVAMGLLGCGNRGTGVMKALLASGKVDLVGLCDVYDQRRQDARALLAPGGRPPFATVSSDELFARKDMDAVVIATPDHLHTDLTVAALGAGKHVYLEKPTTHRIEEGRVLTEVLKKSGKILQTGTQQRSCSHYQRARQEIFATGRLGKVVIARAIWSDFPRQNRTTTPGLRPSGLDWARFLGRGAKADYTPARYETWRLFPEYGSGLLADILTHWADVAQWMLDDAQPLCAVSLGGIYQHNDERKNPDVVNAIVQYKGWNLTFESSVMPLKNRPHVLFEGTEGNLEIDRFGYTFTPAQGEAQVVKASADLDQQHAANFVDAVMNGKAPNAPLAIGLQALRPVYLALGSYWKKKRVVWNTAGTDVVEAS